jgi:xanthine dehydrogenase YagT iron-sulfur-binding subunit
METNAPKVADPAITAPDFTSNPELTLRVNGTEYRMGPVDARMTLLDLLRERLHLTGTKKGCGEGACGACTVHLNRRAVNACMVLAIQCNGREVLTIEGLAALDGSLHPVQRAFIEHDAFQCGFCTPGQVMNALACIQEGHARTDAEIREWMSGNLCRCAAYPQIVEAVSAASGRSAQAAKNPGRAT